MKDLRDDPNTVRRITKREKNSKGNDVYIMSLITPPVSETKTKRGATYSSSKNEFGEWELNEIQPAKKVKRAKEIIKMTYGKNGEPIFETFSS